MSVLISEGMSEFCVAACERITRKDSLITQLNQPNLKVTLDLSNLSPTTSTLIFSRMFRWVRFIMGHLKPTGGGSEVRYKSSNSDSTSWKLSVQMQVLWNYLYKSKPGKTKTSTYRC